MFMEDEEEEKMDGGAATDESAAPAMPADGESTEEAAV